MDDITQLRLRLKNFVNNLQRITNIVFVCDGNVVCTLTGKCTRFAPLMTYSHMLFSVNEEIVNIHL
jgi:hypothetical protein